MSEMEVVGIRVEPAQNQPVLLLRESQGERYLPIWIGQSEAASIALQQKGFEPPRPLTHDLCATLIKDLGGELLEVRIVDMQEGTFYAEMLFSGDHKISARPSDAVAIALRLGVPIMSDEDVLATAGLELPDEAVGAESEEVAVGELSDDDVEKFKEFLDTINPEDFQ